MTQRLARRVAQPLAHPLAPARLGMEQVRGHTLGRGILAGEQARGSRMPADRSAARSCS